MLNLRRSAPLAVGFAMLVLSGKGEAQGPWLARWPRVQLPPGVPPAAVAGDAIPLLAEHVGLTRAAAGLATERTYALEGGIVGAVVFGVAAFVLGGELCRSSDNQHCRSDLVLPALATTAGGGVLGALIGGAMRRAPRDSVP
jgi:hypothetical protein